MIWNDPPRRRNDGYDQGLQVDRIIEMIEL